MPFHLLTKEFYQIVKDHLAEGGVVAQNVEPSTMLFDSAVKTINAVFPQLDFYRADGNIVTVAYAGQRAEGGRSRRRRARSRQDLRPALQPAWTCWPQRRHIQIDGWHR